MKILKDIRFLIALFVLIFVALGSAAVRAANSGKTNEPEHEDANTIAYTTIFYFKTSELRLEIGDAVNSDFLVVTNQAAIVDGRVDGTAVSIFTNPFAIGVRCIGQAQIYLSARMKDGDIKTIACSIEVVNEVNQQNVEKNKDKEETAPLVGKLLYEFESETEIVFSLLVDNKNETVFGLSATVLEGSISVGVYANVVCIIYTSSNYNYKIRVAATINGTIVAVTEVENHL